MNRIFAAWPLLFLVTAHAAALMAQGQSRGLAQDNAAPTVEDGSGHRDPHTPSIPAVSTTLEVKAQSYDALAPVSRVTQAQILSSAGTLGDFSRYLQVLPGVVWNSDLSNAILVRGGHPTENLYVVDGIEFPSINHFSLSGSNGGFTSMIDSAAVGKMELRDGIYDASYSSRLSSLIDIHTREPGDRRQAGDLTAGISGVGGLYLRRLPGKGSLLLAAHRSILNLVTNDIGINGVPIYTNGMARTEFDPDHRNSFSLLSLSGSDSINMTPCAVDLDEASDLQTRYAGWRSTSGASWRHILTPQVFASLSASYSIDSQHIGQFQQEGGSAQPGGGTAICSAAGLLPFYSEDSRNGLTNVSYAVRADMHGWLLTFGADGKLAAPNDSVAQPSGQLSPFSASTSRSDAIAFQRNFTTGQTAGFLQAEGDLGQRWRLTAGIRAETFAIAGTYSLDPRVSLAYRLSERQNLHGSWNLSSQLPPVIDMLSYPGNGSLRPIQVRQQALGMRVWQAGSWTLDADAYSKQYSREPVSTEYPSLMLSNMVDTLGQAFVWLPLSSAGSAQARGLELALRGHWRSRIELLSAVTRSQTSYRALDGVRRAGNYDVPVVANTMGSVRLPVGVQLNVRETYSSGRVYCPFDLADSYAQNRGIYDLTRINALRGPFYNRLDLEAERRFQVGKGAIEIHAGAENVLNRKNLLGYIWLDNCAASGSCYGGVPTGKVDQIGLFPVATARYQF